MHPQGLLKLNFSSNEITQKNLGATFNEILGIKKYNISK